MVGFGELSLPNELKISSLPTAYILNSFFTSVLPQLVHLEPRSIDTFRLFFSKSLNVTDGRLPKCWVDFCKHVPRAPKTRHGDTETSSWERVVRTPNVLYAPGTCSYNRKGLWGSL